LYNYNQPYYPNPASYGHTHTHTPIPGPGPGTLQNGYHPAPPLNPHPNSNPNPNINDESMKEPQFANISYPSISQQPPPFYPSNHPYAYGAGYPHNGYYDYPPPPPPLLSTSNGILKPQTQTQSQNQSLNPAAQGYVPTRREVNGHPFAPVVDGEKLKGLGSGLGLTNGDSSMPISLAPPNDPPPPAEVISLPPDPVPTDPIGPISDKMEDLHRTAPPVKDDPPDPLQEPLPSDSEVHDSITDTEPTPQPIPIILNPITPVPLSLTSTSPSITTPSTPLSPGFQFTGSTLASLLSPPARQKPTIPNGHPTPKSKAGKPVLQLRSSRPSSSTKDNSYSTKLRIPQSIKTITVPTETQTQDSNQTDTHRKYKSVIIFKSPSDNTPIKTILSFGEILPPPPTVVLPKPSWAALLKTNKPFSRTQSTPERILSPVPPSRSVRHSPAKSTISLPDEQVASSTPGHIAPDSSVTASGSDSVQSGPNMVGASNGEVKSTGIGTPEIKSPPKPINYAAAAAAAAGSIMSPHEELIRLLGEGMRRPREIAPVAVARGLINTGNMCFANTVSWFSLLFISFLYPGRCCRSSRSSTSSSDSLPSPHH